MKVILASTSPRRAALMELANIDCEIFPSSCDESKVEGYTDKSIFLPTAGGCNGTNIIWGSSNGNYWSSSLYNEQKISAHFLFISPGNVVNAYGIRYYGFKIRAVLPKS